jgi:hypothetical protein
MEAGWRVMGEKLEHRWEENPRNIQLFDTIW